MRRASWGSKASGPGHWAEDQVVLGSMDASLGIDPQALTLRWAAECIPAGNSWGGYSGRGAW